MKKHIDKILLVIATVLIVIGALVVFSASSSFALFKAKDLTYFLSHQMLAITVGVFAFSVGLFVRYQYYEKYGLLMLGIVFLLLIIVFFMPEKKGATRWIDLGIYSFQPAELAKIVLVLYFARLITKLGEEIQNIKKLIIPITFLGIMMALIAFQPNFSNVLIIGVIGMVVLYIGGAKFKHLAGITLVGIIVLTALMWVTPHTHSRIAGWLGSLTGGSSAPSFQVKEALIGLGSGGIDGVGLGQSQQANLYIPEAYGDFIFAILGEEFGFIGTLIISASYVLFFFLSLIILNQIEDEYGKLVVFGLSFNIVLSAMINILVVLGIVPTTGITLPFISFGGSSLVVFIFSVGVILNVHAGGNVWAKFSKKMNKFHSTFKKIVDANI